MTKLENSIYEKKTRYIRNSISYFEMLKNIERSNDKSAFPSYKLELAKLSNEMDIFFLKIRLILSIIGVVFSIILFMLIIIDLTIASAYSYLERPLILTAIYLYFISISGVLSYQIFKRALENLNFLRNLNE